MTEALVKARAAKIARAGLYAAHVAELCERYDVTTRPRVSNGGRATPRLRMVAFGPVRGAVSYYIALHEIGHVIGRGRSAPKLEQEANAWQWAIDNALVPPTPAVRIGIARRLRSYHARHVRMAHRRYVRFPPSDHVFWTLADVAPPSKDYDGRSVKL